MGSFDLKWTSQVPYWDFKVFSIKAQLYFSGKYSMSEFKSHPSQFFLLLNLPLSYVGPLIAAMKDYKGGRHYKIPIFTNFIAHD